MLSEQLGFDIHQVGEDNELLSSNPGPSKMEDGLSPVYYSDCPTSNDKPKRNGLDLRHKVSVEDNFVSQVYPQQNNKPHQNGRLGSNEEFHTINNLDKKQDASHSNNTSFVSNDMGPFYLSQHHQKNAIDIKQPVWNNKSRLNPRNDNNKEVKCRNSIKKRSGVQAKLQLAKSTRKSHSISNTNVDINKSSNVQVASTNARHHPFYDRPPEQTTAKSNGQVSTNCSLNRLLINEH